MLTHPGLCRWIQRQLDNTPVDIMDSLIDRLCPLYSLFVPYPIVCTYTIVHDYSFVRGSRRHSYLLSMVMQNGNYIPTNIIYTFVSTAHKSYNLAIFHGWFIGGYQSNMWLCHAAPRGSSFLQGHSQRAHTREAISIQATQWRARSLDRLPSKARGSYSMCKGDYTCRKPAAGSSWFESYWGPRFALARY